MSTKSVKKTNELSSTPNEVDVHHEYFVYEVEYGSEHVVDDSIFIIPAFSEEQSRFVLEEIHERRDPSTYGKVRSMKYIGMLKQLVQKDKGFQYFEWNVEE